MTRPSLGVPSSMLNSMPANDNLSSGQFPKKRLYHYGALGEKGAESVRTKGLLPFRQLHPDFYDDDEWTPDHDSVWAFDDPAKVVPGLGKDRVVFEVPETDVRYRGSVPHVQRAVTPEEIVDVELHRRE